MRREEEGKEREEGRKKGKKKEGRGKRGVKKGGVHFPPLLCFSCNPASGQSEEKE